VSAPAGTLGTLRKSLAEGRATLGYLVTTPSVQIAQALARTGVDWLMIDTEHAPIGIESVAAMIAATSGTPATPIVRVPAARPELVKPGRGHRFIVLGSDAGLISGAAQRMVQAIRA
jgi:4-hydroxy-2-oxoheptanedioate aldolase